MDELKPYPMMNFKLNDPEMKFGDGILSMQHKLYAECIDMKETAIIDAIVRTAKDAGVTELFLMDRQFVLDALTDALKRLGAENDST